MKKYGFLFGAGAEIAYKMPSGGKFALDIFREDTSNPKEQFKKFRNDVEITSTYASEWLPNGFKDKNISTFGKSVFQNIIMSTVEHRRKQIVKEFSEFDIIATKAVNNIAQNGKDVDAAFRSILGKPVTNVNLSQVISYNAALGGGNELFNSSYFSGLLLVYKNCNDYQKRNILGKILISIMQLQLGALSEDLARNINDNLFSKKDEKIDLFDDFGELIKLDYNAAGTLGLEYLLEDHSFEWSDPIDIILNFAQEIIEIIYSSVLDYKSLIDTNWHYLYSPSSDWAKFCKIAIFLFTVQDYIKRLGDQADRSNPKGYYSILKQEIENGKIGVTAVATTNYNTLIEEILKTEVTYLNGSVSTWYDPYINKIGSYEDLYDDEQHILVPLLFTQSGTKPMTSIGMSEKYVELYKKWKKADAIVTVGYGFGTDDEHINGIIRTIVNDDKKQLIIVSKGNKYDEADFIREKAKALKIKDTDRIKAILVNDHGKKGNRLWTSYLED